MYVRARVTPKAKKEKVTRIDASNFDISVREPAERNLANARVRELVAEALGVPKGSVRLVSGHHSPGKIFSIDTS